MSRSSDKTRAALRRIRGVCFDIDDTFSTQGTITSEAFAALWKLKKAGFVLVPLTGRPAGWCDHIARFWPVDAVIGENGAFAFYMHEGKRSRLDTPQAPALKERESKKSRLAQAIAARWPQVRWASDQNYREYDLAIDVCEDVSPWNKKEVEELLALCRAAGAQAKLSSVHVNAWFGSYTKWTGFQNWHAQQRKVPPLDRWIFIGDSPNDEPLFEAFKHTVAVANIEPYLQDLKHKPRWITKRSSGAGFVELSRLLLKK